MYVKILRVGTKPWLLKRFQDKPVLCLPATDKFIEVIQYIDNMMIEEMKEKVFLCYADSDIIKYGEFGSL